MSLATEMGMVAPENHVFLPPESKRRIFDRDFSIREITCSVCNTVLCALVIAEEHEADCVWPMDVFCNGSTHTLVAKGAAGPAAKVFCKGRAVQEWEAKKYLEKYA
jgi:hypothetical protein